MNKLETLILLSKVFTGSSNQPSLKESISKKVETDSKKMLLISILGVLSIFFISISIVLSLYLLIDINSNVVMTEKIGYLVATLLILSAIFAFIVSRQFRQKTDEYKELAEKTPDMASPLKIILSEVASELMREHELMKQTKVKKFPEDHINQLH